MSFILHLNPDELATVIPHLAKYENLIETAEPIFILEGRKLEEVVRTIPYHQSKYDRAVYDMKALGDWLDGIKEKRTARLWKKYIEGYQKVLSTRDVQAYIGGEKDIIEVNQVSIEVTLLKNNLNAIAEAIKQLGWMVAHLTKLRVAEIQETIL